jgi:hypothetical protein
MENNVDIKYLNKEFSTFKNDLIEYAKAYFPTVYTDFSKASPGTLFIDMASYVGDVLSFYLDNQIQENFLQYAKQKNNLYAMAHMLGYRPKLVSSAVVDLEVYQVVPAITLSGLRYPDFSYAFIVNPGMVVSSRVSPSLTYYVGNKIDFTHSSSMDPTTVSIYETDGSGAPVSYILKKNATATSGVIKTTTYSFGPAQRFSTVKINDSEIVSIISVVDSSGNKWSEVPYLAQDYIYNPVSNTAQEYPELYQDANQVPYILEKIKVDRRFTSRINSDSSVTLEFGPGINTIADTAVIPNPSTIGIGLTTGSSTINTAFDPTNFVTTTTYGLAPYNTTLTITYLAGGGAEYNARSGEITNISQYSITGNTTNSNTLAITNPQPASGGGDGDNNEQLRQNIRNAFSSQMRAVTQQDYLEKALNMSPKFGAISKAFITRDSRTFFNYRDTSPSIMNPTQISMYVLSYDSSGNLAYPSRALLYNLTTHLSEYRMLTDVIDLKSAYIINIGCNFDIITRPNYNAQEVVSRCITALKEYFNTSNWQINEPIILSNIYSLIDMQDGVQTVKKVEIVNKYGQESGYSIYAYDIKGATINNVIYPSLDPSIFELKYPNTDIQGRVVAFQ